MAASKPRSANELWTGDGLHGPKLAATAARRAVLLAFIDDHSRLLVGWRWGSGEDVFRLEAALRSALMARGVPDAVLVDRGSAFVSSQLLRACAVLGVRLVHASPRAATTKGKIERFFRTVRDQFLVEVDRRPELVELNRLFCAWLEVVYHRRVHSETEQTPLERFAPAGRRRCRPPRCCARRSSGRRSARSPRPRRSSCTPTATRSTRRWPAALELVFDPFDLTRIEVRYQHRPFGLAVPLGIGRHTHPQAQPRSSRRRRRPGSTTSACWPTSATPSWAASGSTTPSSPSPDGEGDDEQRRGRGGRGMSIDRLRAHYGFSRMPFGKDLAPGMLHAHGAHAEAVARIAGASQSRRSA